MTAPDHVDPVCQIGITLPRRAAQKPRIVRQKPPIVRQKIASVCLAPPPQRWFIS